MRTWCAHTEVASPGGTTRDTGAAVSRPGGCLSVAGAACTPVAIRAGWVPTATVVAGGTAADELTKTGGGGGGGAAAPVSSAGKGRSEAGVAPSCSPGGCLSPDWAAAELAAAAAAAAALALACWAARTSGGMGVAAAAVLGTVCTRTFPPPAAAPTFWGAAAASWAAAARSTVMRVPVEICMMSTVVVETLVVGQVVRRKVLTRWARPELASRNEVLCRQLCKDCRENELR